MLSEAEQTAQMAPSIWHQGQTDDVLLKALVEQHHSWTGSLRARDILDDWTAARAKFIKVFPNEYKRALGEIHAASVARAAQAAAVAPPAAVPAK